MSKAQHPDVVIGRQRQARAYERLCELAARGEPMPSNEDLGAFLSARYNKVSDALTRLQQDGLIRLEYADHNRRRATICANGDMTDWQQPWRKPATKSTSLKRTRPRKHRAATPKAPKPKPPRVAKPTLPGAYTIKRALSGGYSDSFLYGHLAAAVRACRRAGDIVYRDPHNKLVILINDKPGDVLARAAWHAGRAVNRNIQRQGTGLSACCTG